MGQKCNPYGLRLGGVTGWKSIWYPNKKQNYADILYSDDQARSYIKRVFSAAGVSQILIKRPATNAKITVMAARPGVIIGKKGEAIDKIRQDLSKLMNVPVSLDVQEIKHPEMDAQLVADGIAAQLEKRASFRRVMKRSMSLSMKQGAKGIKVAVAGRLGGAEIARTEWLREGRVPLHTLRADIDYAIARAETVYGVIGVKVWIFKGEVL